MVRPGGTALGSLTGFVLTVCVDSMFDRITQMGCISTDAGLFC